MSSREKLCRTMNHQEECFSRCSNYDTNFVKSPKAKQKKVKQKTYFLDAGCCFYSDECLLISKEKRYRKPWKKSPIKDNLKNTNCWRRNREKLKKCYSSINNFERLNNQGRRGDLDYNRVISQRSKSDSAVNDLRLSSTNEANKTKDNSFCECDSISDCGKTKTKKIRVIYVIGNCTCSSKSTSRIPDSHYSISPNAKLTSEKSITPVVRDATFKSHQKLIPEVNKSNFFKKTSDITKIVSSTQDCPYSPHEDYIDCECNKKINSLNKSENNLIQIFPQEEEKDQDLIGRVSEDKITSKPPISQWAKQSTKRDQGSFIGLNNYLADNSIDEELPPIYTPKLTRKVDSPPMLHKGVQPKRSVVYYGVSKQGHLDTWYKTGSLTPDVVFDSSIETWSSECSCRSNGSELLQRQPHKWRRRCGFRKRRKNHDTAYNQENYPISTRSNSSSICSIYTNSLTPKSSAADTTNFTADDQKLPIQSKPKKDPMVYHSRPQNRNKRFDKTQLCSCCICKDVCLCSPSSVCNRSERKNDSVYSIPAGPRKSIISNRSKMSTKSYNHSLFNEPGNNRMPQRFSRAKQGSVIHDSLNQPTVAGIKKSQKDNVSKQLLNNCQCLVCCGRANQNFANPYVGLAVPPDCNTSPYMQPCPAAQQSRSCAQLVNQFNPSKEKMPILQDTQTVIDIVPILTQLLSFHLNALLPKKRVGKSNVTGTGKEKKICCRMCHSLYKKVCRDENEKKKVIQKPCCPCDGERESAQVKESQSNIVNNQTVPISNTCVCNNSGGGGVQQGQDHDLCFRMMDSKYGTLLMRTVELLKTMQLRNTFNLPAGPPYYPPGPNFQSHPGVDLSQQVVMSSQSSINIGDPAEPGKSYYVLGPPPPTTSGISQSEPNFQSHPVVDVSQQMLIPSQSMSQSHPAEPGKPYYVLGPPTTTISGISQPEPNFQSHPVVDVSQQIIIPSQSMIQSHPAGFDKSYNDSGLQPPTISGNNQPIHLEPSYSNYMIQSQNTQFSKVNQPGCSCSGNLPVTPNYFNGCTCQNDKSPKIPEEVCCSCNQEQQTEESSDVKRKTTFQETDSKSGKKPKSKKGGKCCKRKKHIKPTQSSSSSNYGNRNKT